MDIKPAWSLAETEKRYPKLEIKKGKWRLALLKAGEELEKHGMDYEVPNNANILVKAAVRFWQALFNTSDIAFFKELGDRMDGKAAQEVTLKGDADAPLFISNAEELRKKIRMPVHVDPEHRVH